jgi:hypothetical protein
MRRSQGLRSQLHHSAESTEWLPAVYSAREGRLQSRVARDSVGDGLPTLDGRVLFVHGDCFIVWDSERAAI